MRGPLPILLALTLVWTCACTTDPCDEPPAPEDARLSVGVGTSGLDFEPLEPGQDYTLVMGEQGVAMFHRLALRADGVVPQATGRTDQGWSLSAETMDGAPLAKVRAPYECRATPEGFEVVGIRLIPEPPPLQVWDTDVILKGSVVGRCGATASVETRVKASRVP